MMLASGMTKTELQELLDQIVGILEDEELSAGERLAEMQDIVFGDGDEDG